MKRAIISRIGFAWLAGNRRLFIACLLLFCFSAALSFWWFFPAELLQRKFLQLAMQATGLQLRGKEASLLLPLGMKFDLEIGSQGEGLTDVEIEGLRITPVWGRLLSADPAATMRGDLAGGRFAAQVGRSGTLELQLQEIDLLTFQRPDNRYRVSGRLEGRLSADQLTENGGGRGDFTFVVDAARLQGLRRLGLPDAFNLGFIQTTGKFNQRRVSIERFVASEGNLEVSGGGTFLIGETPERTRLNLNLRLHPDATTPESLRELIQLTGVRPTADGSYLLRVGGTLAKPVVR